MGVSATFRGWLCLGSGHPFAKGNSRGRGTGKVQISARQATRWPVLPVGFPYESQRITIHGKSKIDTNPPEDRKKYKIQKNKKNVLLLCSGVAYCIKTNTKAIQLLISVSATG